MSAALRDLARAKAVGAVPTQKAPTPKPLPPELLPVQPFPLGALPDAFRPWVADVAERMHCPPDFVAVPMLVAAASLVSRRVGIRPQGRTDWFVRGNLWAAIVGRPGYMKSPAMAQALAPLEKLEARAAETYNAETAAHQAQALAAKLKAEAAHSTARAMLKKDGSADVLSLLASDKAEAGPLRRRYLVNDMTYEKAGEVLAQNPDGVLLMRDELRGLLLHLGAEDAATARGFYLQAWSGGRYVFDRIGRGTVTVEDARLSIIGGIQPGPLSELVHQARRGGADDGMLERFLVAWPDAPGQWREVDRWPDSQAKRQAWQTFERLDTLTAESLRAEQDTDTSGAPQGGHYLRFEPAALEPFREWRTDLEASLRAAEGEGLEGALSKFRTHVPALALLLHVADGGAGPVGLAPTLRALVLAEYFESHTRRLHSSGRRVVLAAARAILKKAQGGDLPETFRARDVYRNQWAGLGDKETVAEALDMLAAHDWLTETELPTGGRPTVVYALTEGARHG
jgi:hypothetical protein